MATSLAEFDLIQRYFTQPFSDFSAPDQSEVAQQKSQVILGIGDDAAILTPGDGQIVMASDTLNAGVHFPETAAPADIASRALYCNLSDLAAMGASPWVFTLALSMPASDNNWLAEFSGSLAEHAKACGLHLIGGDTTKGPLAITLSLLGKVPNGLALRRDSACIGDDIYHSGHLGGSACALHAILNGNSDRYWRQVFYQPPARVQLGMELRELANAAIDVSDGLVADLTHILLASGCGAVINTAELNCHEYSQRYCADENRSMLQAALTGGEDFELCFTASPANRDKIQQLSQRLDIPLTVIGKVTALENSAMPIVGVPDQYLTKGYQHF